MIVQGVHDEAALIRLGAWRVGDLLDEAGEITTAVEIDEAFAPTAS